MAATGVARRILVHTPFDGDLTFALDGARGGELDAPSSLTLGVLAQALEIAIGAP